MLPAVILVLYLMGQTHAYQSVAYFVNWVRPYPCKNHSDVDLMVKGIYARNYTPGDLPADRLTHLNYAFAGIDPVSGNVVLSDPFADLEKHYPGDSWTGTPGDLFGNLKQIFLLKKRHRKLKVLLSIGGWGIYSSHLAKAASTSTGRSNFARSAVRLVADLGLDDEAEADSFVQLLQATHEALDQSTGLEGHPAILTAAISAGPDKYGLLHLESMDRYITFWNLMAYDYAGSWSSAAGHQANLFPSAIPDRTPFSTEAALDHYIGAAGLNASKINIGVPLYGRAFCGTKGLGSPFSGVGSGSWEDGVWDYKALPLPGSVEYYDSDAVGWYSYDEEKKVMVTYDSVRSAREKADYIRQRGLGGAMYWEASGDGVSNRSLIEVVTDGLGSLETTLNSLDYPTSKYKNVRAMMDE
ncbi:hypothetical protein FQN50_003602 [Emmonsiellopsis sp. PD_5]|nr:hypothetical protein FQN50_003602 [Emmonsiellopsis sp. PD_5]